MNIETILSTFLAVGWVSVISLVGIATLYIGKTSIKNITFLLVSLAAGTLIGDSFLHILPEAYEAVAADEVSIAVLTGLLTFFVLEKFLQWHHHHGDDHTDHAHVIGINNLFADGLHNFIDGVIIAAGFMAGSEIGIATTIAVILHEIPQEIGDYGVLIHAGFSRSKALMFNLLSALSAVLGAAVALVVGGLSEEISAFLLAFTAGSFIYIALADLVPELHKERQFTRNLLQIGMVVTGVAIMWLLTLAE